MVGGLEIMAKRWWGITFYDRDTKGGPLVKGRKIKLKEGYSPLDKLSPDNQHPLFTYETRGERILDREASNFGSIMIKWYRGTKKMFEEWW